MHACISVCSGGPGIPDRGTGPGFRVGRGGGEFRFGSLVSVRRTVVLVHSMDVGSGSKATVEYFFNKLRLA